jgi:hypothetical protein
MEIGTTKSLKKWLIGLPLRSESSGQGKEFEPNPLSNKSLQSNTEKKTTKYKT